jgi:hypothetical protein
MFRFHRVTKPECWWSILFVGGPSSDHPLGILVLHKATDLFYAKLKDDWKAANENDQVWWDYFREELLERSGKAGGWSFVEQLQDSASHFVTVSDAEKTDCIDPASLLDTLYAHHIGE